ncbi:MAG: hypothetical protein AB1640_03910 [bacterium]
MNEKDLQFLKQATNFTDKEVEKLSPGMKKLFTNIDEKMGKWTIVAEVTDAKNCFAGHKKGDKIVIDYPFLNIEKSTTPRPCLCAVAPLIMYVRVMLALLSEGIDPNKSIYADLEHDCMDPGLEHGGMGKVHLKLRAVRAD